MAIEDGIDTADLRLLASSGAAIELIAMPVERHGATWWTLDVVLNERERRPVVKAQRFRSDRKRWRQLTVMYHFIEENVPQLTSFTVMTSAATKGTQRKKKTHA